MSINGISGSGQQSASVQAPQSKSKWTTRQLVTLSLMCALAILLSFIEFPIFPAASFLKLDASFVPSTVMALSYGTPSGIMCAVACAVAHGIITGNWVGALMNIIASVVFILPAALIYSRMKSIKGMVIGFIVATVCLIVGASIANLIIDPIFYGMPFEAVSALIVPAIAPFNLIKGVVLSVLSILIYKSIKGILLQETSNA